MYDNQRRGQFTGSPAFRAKAAFVSAQTSGDTLDLGHDPSFQAITAIIAIIIAIIASIAIIVVIALLARSCLRSASPVRREGPSGSRARRAAEARAEMRQQTSPSMVDSANILLLSLLLLVVVEIIL